MLALMSAIFVASLLGSTHCAGMCGAFVAFAVGAPGTSGAAVSRVSLNAAYNLGRLVTYVGLGVTAGMLGALCDFGGAMLGVQRCAAVAAGGLMVGFGVVALLRHSGVKIAKVRLPSWYLRLAERAHARAFELPPLTRAAAVGLLTTLLPCGWLYAFVVTAAGTADPVWAGLAMAAFWAGTLPVMGAIGMSVRSVAGPLGRRLPLATSLLLVSAGLWTVLGRLPVAPMTARVRPVAGAATVEELTESAHEACPYCHEGEGAP